jgi:rieske iron-sulfur protein
MARRSPDRRRANTNSARRRETVSDSGYRRRTLIRGAIGLGLTLPVASAQAAQDDPKKARPQAGDRLVFFTGDRKGQVIKPDDLALGGPQILAYPMDSATDTVRNGSRLNQVLLVRFEESQLTDASRANAADGVVAYSATCTHQACPVSMWQKEAGTLFCSCHGSQFDPKNAARVVAGPATRKLAMLPIKIESGEVVVAGSFTSRVGGEQQ